MPTTGRVPFQELFHAGSTVFNSCVAAHSDLRIRLANKASNKTGRVEIFHPSFGRGTVCDDDWDDSDSAVVCRQLGFDEMNTTGKNAHHGPGNGPTLLGDVRCPGNESYIWDRSYSGWSVDNFIHNEDVSVDCY